MMWLTLFATSMQTLDAGYERWVSMDVQSSSALLSWYSLKICLNKLKIQARYNTFRKCLIEAAIVPYIKSINSGLCTIDTTLSIYWYRKHYQLPFLNLSHSVGFFHVSFCFWASLLQTYMEHAFKDDPFLNHSTVCRIHSCFNKYNSHFLFHFSWVSKDAYRKKKQFVLGKPSPLRIWDVHPKYNL